MKDIRYVVVHTPGPAWKAGVPLFEQDGLQQHIGHFHALFEQGKLVMGGPYLDAAGGSAVGMMIPEAGLSQAEITEFANADPSVASGLLRAEVRPWLVGMKKEA